MSTRGLIRGGTVLVAGMLAACTTLGRQEQIADKNKENGPWWTAALRVPAGSEDNKTRLTVAIAGSIAVETGSKSQESYNFAVTQDKMLALARSTTASVEYCTGIAKAKNGDVIQLAALGNGDAPSKAVEKLVNAAGIVSAYGECTDPKKSKTPVHRPDKLYQTNNRPRGNIVVLNGTDRQPG